MADDEVRYVVRLVMYSRHGVYEAEEVVDAAVLEISDMGWSVVEETITPVVVDSTTRTRGAR